jgi:hypothetical protein
LSAPKIISDLWVRAHNGHTTTVVADTRCRPEQDSERSIVKNSDAVEIKGQMDMILIDCLIEQVTQGWQCRHIKFASQANDENIINQ